jgi:hypothetical protein
MRLLLVCLIALAAAAPAKTPAAPAKTPVALAVDETPAKPGEWGFRPEEGEASAVNPPAFVWRPQRGAAAYELQCARDAAFAKVEYSAPGLAFNCHTPPKTLAEGNGFWRFRFTDAKGSASPWSQVRTFTIPRGAVAFPMPAREDLLSRIPKQHPRLFMRPEDLPRLREQAKGDLKKEFDGLVRQCDRLLKNPPPSAEPPKYPPDAPPKSEAWRVIWWGNRTYTVKVLDSAATLAFTRLLGGNDEYGRLAKKLLLDAAQWDPVGSTGFRYNDEAGMPFSYLFSRTYTFVYDLLSEEERAKCREVMTVRGREMYRHLCPKQLWTPYESHANRGWHKLGEAAIAFQGEIPEAADWAWFAQSEFFCTYPVWCDTDGGWHEGISYWAGYMEKFTWYADVMRAAYGIDAFKKPFFSQIGYYPMYLQPPGTVGGGFGDLVGRRKSSDNAVLMTAFAAQARNPYWQWYAETIGGPKPASGYVGFVRGAIPRVEARPPTDLPTSRCFRGTGQAYLNTTLASAADNVEVMFKSSPFGLQSHGYDSNNAFALSAFGSRLFISSGERDIYGSAHHSKWMWETKSVNSVTVNGQGQTKHTSATRGRIVGFATSAAMDYVAGEAGDDYGDALKRFTRHIVFVKPDLVIIFDRLEAPKASTFEWLLHTPTEMKVAGQGDIRVTSGAAAARVALLAPQGLAVSLTDKFDPPPRERIKLVEWHLTAQSKPAERTEFVAVIRPHRAGSEPQAAQTLRPVVGGYVLEAVIAGGRVVAILRSADKGRIADAGRAADADVAAVRLDASGRPVAYISAAGAEVRTGVGDLPK